MSQKIRLLIATCTKRMVQRPLPFLFLLAVTGFMPGCAGQQDELPISGASLALLKDNVRTGFANGGWKYDRYDSLKSLDAQSRITVADLKGPGVITQIHTTRHHPAEVFARGVVLEIYFDGSDKPAVLSPLADFFGDGCNGKSRYFSASLVECAPWSYNCYFPMPFKERAQVILRNETDRNAWNYSYVEWESLPSWDSRLGYFHATYQRRPFRVTPQSVEEMFHVEGKGHFLGRQYSIVTDEPLFKKFMVVMEGNNEVDIDGRERVIDYLGTEDSFTFSWGFQEPFTGNHAGMPLVETDSTQLLSIYRFHDHMPIRFNRSLKWKINWAFEDREGTNPQWAIWKKVTKSGGCWVDYATVHYWYMNVPGGYEHAPLASPAERRKQMLRSDN